MADKNSERAAKIASASKRGKDIEIRSSYMSLIDMINTRGDEYPSTAHLDSFNHCNTWHNIDFNKLNARYNVPPPFRLVPVSGGDRTCHWRPDTLFIYTDALNAGLRFPFHPFIPHLLADLQINPCQLPPNAWRNILCFMVCCLREGFPLSVAVFRKVFQCYNSSSNICGWVYVKQRPKSKHIFNSASIPDNNPNWRNSFVGLRWENGDWGTLFRSSFGKVSDGSLKSIHLTPEETIIYNGLTQDDGTTTSWTLLEEFSLIHVGLSSVSQQAAKEINEDNVPLVEETARMKKARLAGLDTRGKATEPIFLRKHKEPMGEASTEGAEGHNAPITAAAPAAAATGAFQPLWGFRRGDTVVGSTKHAWDWSYRSVTPKDFTDVVVKIYEGRRVLKVSSKNHLAAPSICRKLMLPILFSHRSNKMSSQKVGNIKVPQFDKSRYNLWKKKMLLYIRASNPEYMKVLREGRHVPMKDHPELPNMRMSCPEAEWSVRDK
ncbi:uncharacterized protein LOC141724864 [Apium graveolens]|uniref:uncharacterized protein LOC141724864 n=1 Tax=Apium graveolens TaxID=4045 RepID=UPI003D7B29B8